jgi:small conductance mechanosensitive channel
MMKTALSFLQVVLLVCLAGTSAAQTKNVAQTDSAAQTDTAAQTASEVEAEKIQDLVQGLDQGIQELQTLSKLVDSVPEMDREAVVFRRDERSFKVLRQLDTLARRTAELPADDPQRVEIERRLREDFAGVADAVFSRIDELSQRIATFTGELESLSGGPRIASEAYIFSLEAMRMQSYAALVDIIEGRKALGMPADDIAQRLQGQLYLRAEILVGRIEYTGAAANELQGRLQADPQNTELDSAARTFSSHHQRNIERLTAISALLERLDLDNSAYKSVLVKQGQGLSVRDFESAVAVDLLRDGWAALRQSLVDQTPDILFKLLIFILIILAFRVLSRLTRRAVVAACNRPGVDLSALLKDILASVCSGTVMVIGVLMALSQVGITLGPMLAGLGVAGFVVGFALQDTLSNFAAGGMILIYRPYDVDDFIEVAGASGLVKKMNLVSTTITTFDNQTLVVPNSKIWGDVIKNVTAQKLRRVDLEFGIGYSDDIEKAERVLEDIVSQHDMVLKKPETMIKLHTLADSSVNFVVRPWVKTDDYWDVYWDITREVKLRFDREGISIPFPQRDVHLYNEQA